MFALKKLADKFMTLASTLWRQLTSTGLASYHPPPWNPWKKCKEADACS
jgi:hypothetical protein